MKNLILTSLLVLAGIASEGQTITPLSTTTPVAGGSTYFLPQVGLVIHVPIKTTTYTLGPDYACGIEFFYFETDDKNQLRTLINTSREKKKYFKDIDPYKAYKLDDITVSPKSIIDVTKGYSMKIKGGGNKASFTYDENGFLVSGSVENINNPLSTILKATDATVSLLRTWGPSYDSTECYCSTKPVSSSSTKPVSYSSIKPKDCPIIETIHKLLAIKDTLLLKTSVAGGGLIQQLEAIDKRIQFHMDRIVTVTEKIETISFFVLPDKTWLACSCDKDLFIFNDKQNILTINQDLYPQLLTESYNRENVMSGFVENGYKLVLQQLKKESVVDYFSGLIDSTHRGLAYNIPEKCSVSVRKGNTVFSNQRVDFPQFGKVGFMPQKLKKLDFTLNPLTGALRSMTGESKTLFTSDNVDQTSKIIDQFKKDSPPNEKESLAEEVSILELQVKKKKAKEELEKPD